MRTIILLFLVSAAAFGQVMDNPNMKAQPIGGKGELQIVYYRIDFTPEETQYLRTHAAELIFSVSESGIARLEKVNDIGMQSIVNKMLAVNDRLPAFYPERVNGRREAGVYFLYLTWPNYQGTYGLTSPYPAVQFYNPVMRKLSDFSEITYRGPRFDMLLGAFSASFAGNIGKNINRGWGTKFDFMAYGKNGWGGGFGTTMIIARQWRTDPAQQYTFQNRSHLITLFTGTFGKVFETSVGDFGLQVEPAFGLTDIINRDQSNKAISLGFSPGVVAVYMMPLGKGRMGRQYFLPVTYRQYFSFHVAARQIMFNTQESRGTVYEFGMAYRFAQRQVANYKVKE